MAVTVYEVAKAAGVSTATVSRVLAGKPTVDEDLAALVRSTAERLGYRPNRVARSLRVQSTQTVGIVVPDLTNPFFPAVVQAVENTLDRHGRSLLLCDSGNDVEAEMRRVRNLLDHRIDGLLISVCDRTASQRAVRFAASRVPVVQLDRRALTTLPYVGVDQAAAMNDVISHLLDQGCNRFGYISSSPEISTSRERLTAFLRRLRPSDPGLDERVHIGDFSLAWGAEAARRLLRVHPLPDAIVCSNDLNAVGALEALSSAGLRVPQDVALTGFDDTVLATTSRPRLTTVRQPVDDLAETAVAALLAAIQDPASPPHSIALPAILVPRDSTRRR